MSSDSVDLPKTKYTSHTLGVLFLLLLLSFDLTSSLQHLGKDIKV